MEFIEYILAGAAVGLAIGLTGVGGGSLMTPLLLLFGFPPHVAIGTDLLYAAVTKAGGVAFHQRHRNIDWRISTLLAAGSLPASALTVIVLAKFFPNPESYRHLLTSSLGVMLILTSIVLLLKRKIAVRTSIDHNTFLKLIHQHSSRFTLITGFALGVFVTLSSVGAGAFGTALLLILYPHLSSVKVVGTDLAHAVALTLFAGLGHLYLGHVDFGLLGALLIGSLPATYLGAHLGTRLPERWLFSILASALMALGVKYAFF